MKDYDGTDVVFNGKADAVVDLRDAGNVKVFTRNDGGGSEGDFREGTVAIRTRNGVLVIAAMDLEDQECFDVSYRVGPVAERKVKGKDFGSITVDDNERTIAALGFAAGQRIAFEDAEDNEEFGADGIAARRVKATGSQGARLIALVIDK